MKLKDLFKQKSISVCTYALKWLGDKTLQEAFAECKRGDWMLWAHYKLYPEKIRELTLAKGHCANTVRHLMKDERSRDAVDAAIAFGEGKITKDKLRAAADAAAAAAAANADAAANAYAADIAAYAAADVAAYAAAAAYADTYAAAAYTAADAAAAAHKKHQQQTADICRKYLNIDSINRKDVK